MNEDMHDLRLYILILEDMIVFNHLHNHVIIAKVPQLFEYLDYWAEQDFEQYAKDLYFIINEKLEKKVFIYTHISIAGLLNFQVRSYTLRTLDSNILYITHSNHMVLSLILSFSILPFYS